MIKRVLTAVTLAAVAAALVVAGDAYRQLYRPLSLDSPMTYELTPGSSVARVAADLADRGLLARPVYLTAYARLSGQDARLQAGEYLLQSGLNAIDVLHKMERGDVRQHNFTIIEGWAFSQLRAALANADAIRQTLPRGLDHAGVMAELGYPDVHPEGRFYPDTYLFPRGTTDVAFLRRAYERMERVLERQWRERGPELPLDSPDEALILASIIEKESAVPEERPMVAAVFVNRLKRGMRLQTDPTVIYGMGERFDGDIRFRDLRRDTPYNTYTRGGLPPTPIAMPSEASIHAALHPADSPVLYFVSRNDGSHQFSTTLSEHEAAVDRYQRRR